MASVACCWERRIAMIRFSSPTKIHCCNEWPVKHPAKLTSQESWGGSRLATVSTVKFNRHWLQWFLSMAAESYLLLINLWLHIWYVLNHGCDFSGGWSPWSERTFQSPAVMLACHCFGTFYCHRTYFMTPETILSHLCSLFPSSLGLFLLSDYTYPFLLLSRHITNEKTETFALFSVHLTRIHFPLKYQPLNNHSLCSLG